MFIGHFGVALAAKRVAPRTSLGTLILAAQFLDFLWPVFLLLGIEHVRIAPEATRVSPLDFTDYPISHSLLTATVWAVIFGAVYYAIRHNSRSALVVSAAVLSHWVLDFIVHRPDLQLYPGSEVRVGMGVWNSLPATIVLEVGFFAAGLWTYVSCTRARDNSRTLRILGARRISSLWMGQHALCRCSAQRDRSRLGRDRDVADGPLGLVGGPASRRHRVA